MPVQLIHKVRNKQPQYTTRIDWSNPLTIGLKVAVFPSCGMINLVTGRRLVVTSATSPKNTSDIFGKALLYSAAQNIQTEAQTISGGLTQVVLAIPTSTANQCVIGNSSTTGLWSLWFPFSGKIQINDGVSYIDSGVTVVSGKPYSVGYSVDGTNLTYCINGVLSNKTSASPSYTFAQNIGSRKNGGDYPFSGDIAGYLLFDKAVDSAKLKALTENPWQIFEPETIPLFFTASTGGSTDLSIFDALHSHSGDNLAFSLDTYLAAQDSSHAHSADNLTLVTGSYLELADSLHGHSADVITLATDSLLAVAEALHAHAADNLTLDSSNATPLTTQDATHAHSADNTALTLDTWLAIVEAVHANSADNVSISSEELLAIADALHSLASDALVLTLPSPPGTCPTVDEIKVAVWQHIIESGVSAEAMLRIVSAVLAGKVSGANTGVETFVGIDGVTNRVVSTVDSVGNRTSVTVDGA